MNIESIKNKLLPTCTYVVQYCKYVSRVSTPPPPQHMDKSFTLTFNVILMFYLHVIKK